MRAPILGLPLHDPSQWPVRMLRVEVIQVLGWAPRTFARRVKAGRFPRPDSDRQWGRETVARYMSGGIREFDRLAARAEKSVARRAVAVAG